MKPKLTKHIVSFIRSRTWIAAEKRVIEEEPITTHVEFVGMPQDQKAYAASFGSSQWKICLIANGVEEWLTEDFVSDDAAQVFLEGRLAAV